MTDTGHRPLWYDMHMESWRRQCIAVDKNTKEKFQLSFIIHQPTQYEVNFGCVCEITGAPDLRTEIYGLDAIQAIELGIRFLQSEFESLSKTFDFYYITGEKMMSFTSPA